MGKKNKLLRWLFELLGCAENQPFLLFVSKLTKATVENCLALHRRAAFKNSNKLSTGSGDGRGSPDPLTYGQ